MKAIKQCMVAGIICLMTFCISVAPSIAEKPYKIGAILEVTGGLSFLGEPGKNTFEMIADEINKAGGINGHPLKLIVYDTEGNPTRAVILAQRLIKKDKVSIMLGPMSSGSALAVIPIVQKAKIPLIALGASRKIVEPPKKWVFNTVQTDTNVVTRIYQYMNKVGIKKVGIITASDAFGESGREQLIGVAPKFGIQVVASEEFGPKDFDMTPQLTRIQRTDAQAIICWTVGPTEAVVTKNWKQLAMKVPLFQSHGAASEKFLKMTGNASEGIILACPKLIVADQLPNSDPQKAILLQYKNAYEERFKENVSKFGGNAYDAIQIAIKALKAVGPHPAKIRDYIENLKRFIGVVGTYNYSPTNHNGLTEKSIVMVKVVHGTWKLLK